MKWIFKTIIYDLPYNKIRLKYKVFIENYKKDCCFEISKNTLIFKLINFFKNQFATKHPNYRYLSFSRFHYFYLLTHLLRYIN